jgi:hypothetical protein
MKTTLRHDSIDERCGAGVLGTNMAIAVWQMSLQQNRHLGFDGGSSI